MAQSPKFDVNDVPFLWPVPVDEDGVKKLIPMDTALPDETNLWPLADFDHSMVEAEKAAVNSSKITFPNAGFKKPGNWKVVGIIAVLFPTESAAFINENYPAPQPSATDAGIINSGLFWKANLPFS